MSYWETILLAIVQGITEFLPVSSSGHLVVAETLFSKSLEGTLDLNIVLHLGTLLAVIVYYWRRIRQLLRKDRRVILLLLVGTIPAVIVGLVLKTYAQQMLTSPLLAGCMFPVTAAMLIWVSRQPDSAMEYQDLTIRSALLIGCAQAVAILPGISRSGSTIVAGVACGLNRTSAATFSFLLAIPAISGAGILILKDLLSENGSHSPPSLLLLGTLVSFVVGYIALVLLIRLVNQRRLFYFAFWLIPLGVFVVGWQLFFA